MSLPPRRPSQPIIRGPKPVTTRVVRPAGSAPVPTKAAEPSQPTPTPAPNPLPEQKIETSNQQQNITTVASGASTTISVTQNPTAEEVMQPKKITTKPIAKQPAQPKKNQERSGTDPIKILLILLVLMLGGVVGYLAYDKFKSNENFAAQMENSENTILSYKSEIDLKVDEISKLQDSLRIVISEKEALGIALTNEQARIADLENLKDQVQKKQLSINALNRKLAASNQQYASAKASVGNLAAENQRLVSEKVRLENLVQEKIDSIQNLSVIQASVAAQPTIKAPDFIADNIFVMVYNTGGKEMKNPKAMMAGKIKATLSLGANGYADSGPKDIYLRVIEPSGNTLYSGNKSFEADGKKVIYTEKQTVNFNNAKQNVTFYYNKGSRYTPGRYSVEIWSDAKKIGQSEFVLQK
jgi:uncharacterized protein (UPF0333 family)